MSDETWMVECLDGVREVSVNFRPDDMMPTWLAYCYAERRGGMISQNSARHAVIELAANHKWDVERIVAPGQPSRAEVEADAFRRGMEATRAAAKRVCDDVEASAKYSSEADVALRCGARIDALTMAEVTK